MAASSGITYTAMLPRTQPHRVLYTSLSNTYKCVFVCLYTNVHKSYSRAHVRVSLGMCVFERNCIYIYKNILTQHTYSGYALIMYVCVCLCVWVDTNKRTLILCTETYTRTYVNN